MNARACTLHAALAAVALLLTVLPASAQFGDPDALWDGGRVSFSYAQTPFPFYSGSFLAEGEGLLPDGTFPPDATAAVGGASVAAQPDTVTTIIYGVKANPSSTYDGALIVLRTAGPLTPGSYPVNLETASALFIFIDEAQSFTLPDSPEYQDVMDWLEALSPEKVLVSITGAINVAAAGSDTLHGTFSGLTVDPENALFLVNVSNGQFSLSGADLPTAAPVAPALAVPTVTAWPNPFNPRTSVVFSLPQAQAIDAAVYDLAGRRVRTLHQGPLAAGEQRLPWSGLDLADRRAPSGVYVVRVAGEGWQRGVKVVLAP